MTRVALMHEHSWPTVQRGGERYLHDIAWYLDRHTTLQSEVVTVCGRPRRDQVDGVPVHRIWATPFAPLGRAVRRAPSLASSVSAAMGRRALARVSPTVVHALSPAAARAGARAGVPTVFTILGAHDPTLPRRNPGRWAQLVAACGEAQAVTAVGRQAADRFTEALDREVHALQPGLRLEAFPARLAPRTGPPRILFASTVDPRYKGFHALLEAFPAILAAHPDARLVVLGPGDVERQIQEASPAVHRVREQIDRRLPPTDRMPAEFAAGTVTVLASRGEAFGLVLAESLACGTPIVASSEGGPAEILKGAKGRVGFSATPHHVDEIAEATIAAIELAADSTAPAACREHATRWGWVEGIGPRHERLYREVVHS